MARIIVKTAVGLEGIAIEEVKSILAVNAKKLIDGRIIFESSDADKLIKNTRSSELAYSLLKQFKFKTLADIISSISGIDFSFIKKDFVVKCSRDGKHDFNSVDVAKRVGEFIFNKGHKVNMDSNEVIYVDIIHDACIIGILLKDRLGKRSYRVKINNQSISPLVAFALLKLSDFKASESILDPFCRDGVILIEAALFGGKKLYGIDNENNVRNARINAAMAKSKIAFYPASEKENLKQKIDKIITCLPLVSANNKNAESLLANFFKETCKKAKVSITCLAREAKFAETLAKKHGFHVLKKIAVVTGGQLQTILVILPKRVKMPKKA